MRLAPTVDAQPVTGDGVQEADPHQSKIQSRNPTCKRWESRGLLKLNCSAGFLLYFVFCHFPLTDVCFALITLYVLIRKKKTFVLTKKLISTKQELGI